MCSTCSKVFIVYFNYWTRSIIPRQQTVCFLPRVDWKLPGTGERKKVLSSYFDQVRKNFVYVILTKALVYNRVNAAPILGLLISFYKNQKN